MAKDSKDSKTLFRVGFVREKETKGAWRYQEVDAAGKPVEDYKAARIGSIYIRKDALKSEAPGVLVLDVQLP